MKDIKTLEEFVTVLEERIAGSIEEEDVKKYRYVIYVRKSTDEEEKQIRSLGDQIKECREFADRNNLYVPRGAIIQESESAKEPDKRPKFRRVIEDVKSNKYDGIISWHPDRLARNMKDAGEIIDLLDKNEIKDLKFPSFTFENTTDGKMLLGITFVLSKQYSDHLSDNVKRGIKRSILEGKYINKAKPGYAKDDNQFLKPDGDNFVLVKETFQMRLRGATLDEIAQYLNDSGYTRKNTKKGKTYSKIAKQGVAKYLKDPVYTGALIYGEHVIDLTKMYDFKYMVTVGEFLEINKLDDLSQLPKLSKAYRKGDKVKANLMMGMITCSECGETMSTGLTSKKHKNGTRMYFYYRCCEEDCSRKGKSVRAKVIRDFIYDYLSKNPFSSLKAYNHYKDEIKNISGTRLKEKKAKMKRFVAKRQSLKKMSEDMKLTIIEERDKDLKKVFKKDLKVAIESIEEFEMKIAKVRDEIDRHKSIPLTYEEFIELWENMATTLKNTKRMEDLDTIIKKIFTNFIVSAKKVEEYKLNSPFDKLENVNVSTSGR